MADQLFPDEVRAAMPALYATSGIVDPPVAVKFFQPDGAATWYALEFDGDDTFFGFVTLGDPSCAELGYFSLSELRTYRGRYKLPVERDEHFRAVPLSEAKRRVGCE